MSIESVIEGFVHKQEHSAEKILAEVSPFLAEARSVSTELSLEIRDLATLTHDQLLLKVERYLESFVKDSPTVVAFMSTALHLPVPTLLLNASSLALAHFKPANQGVALVVLQTALQFVHLEYSKISSTAGKSTFKALLATASPS